MMLTNTPRDDLKRMLDERKAQESALDERIRRIVREELLKLNPPDDGK